MQRNASIVAAVFLLATMAACSKPEPATEATPDVEAMAPAAAEIAATPSAAASAVAAWDPALPPPGDYEVTTVDGAPLAKVTIEPDKSYLQLRPQGLSEAGVVKLEAGKVCFDPSGKDRPSRCYGGSTPAADGSFIAIAENGAKEIVRPVVKQAP